MVQLMPLHPKTPSPLASIKSRLVLPFWYRLTQAVMEKRPLNGCNVVVLPEKCCNTGFSTSWIQSFLSANHEQ